MPFLNIYEKPTNYFYTYTVKSGNAFYFVGKTGEDLLVLKTDLAGNVLWEKRYGNPYSASFATHDITYCDNGDILILINNTGALQDFIIIRIGSAQGTVVWSKRYQMPYQGRFTMSRVSAEAYVVYTVAPGTMYGSSALNTITLLLKLDATGSVTAKKAIGYQGPSGQIYGSGVNHEMITSDANYIYICFNHGFLKLNYNLELVNKFQLQPGTNVEQIRIVNGTLNIIAMSSFEDNGPSAVSLLSVPFPNTSINQQVIAKRYQHHGLSATCNDTSLFLMNTYPKRTVQKVDIATNSVLWTKKFDTPSWYNIQVTNQEMIFYIFQNSYSTTPIVNMVGVMNLDFENCKVTPDTPIAALPDITIGASSNFTLTFSDAIPITITSVTHAVTSVSSVKREQCAYPSIPVEDKTMLQSSHLYIQAAGSTGADSAKGIHLRWMLKNGLENHLPKADYALTTANFNKPDDFVKIYKAPYTPQKTTLNLGINPNSVNNTSKTWMYTIGQRAFYVFFRSANIYSQVQASINPQANPVGFLTSYFSLNGILEVENQDELAFAITSTFNSASQAVVKVEYLSVEDNKPNAAKFATLRKTLSFGAISGQKFFSENIRSIRLQSSGTFPQKIEFEFYSDFLGFANSSHGWDEIGEHALTLSDSVAYNRLESQAGLVDGKWLRYNDQAYVNLKNYKTKWNGQDIDPEERILETVKKYIELSNDIANPTGIQQYFYDAVPVNEQGDEDASSFEISNLYLLQVASLDYHIARMIGLGMLDIDSKTYTGQYIYAAEYTSLGNLKDGLGAREVNHVYMSLPTGINDQRLPLPVDLKFPVPGIFTSSDIESPSSITGPDGYTPDGRARFLTLYNENLPEEAANAPFFYKPDEFLSEKNTLPVYAGLEYRRTADPQWRKPELAFSGKYYNTDNTVSDGYQKSETVSIVIPEPGNPLFVHREKQSGWHDYSSYGINWFGRATSSTVVHKIETKITPANEMLPPTNVQATFIQKESPLFLTSASEQLLLDAIDENNDKTLVRLTFEYNHAQELISYHQKIGDEIVAGYAELPPNEEPFAEYFEIFYRNRVPGSISGKVNQVVNDTNTLRSRITTAPYVITSSQDGSDTIVPAMVTGTEDNYAGSVMLIDENEYIIHSVDNSGAYPVFIVWKRYAGGSAMNAGPGVPEALAAPVAGGLFLIVENMQLQSSWNTGANTNPLDLEIVINNLVVHQESIITYNAGGESETHIHKFRGIYKDAVIEKVMEDIEVYQNDYDPPQIEQRHLGMYKITFPGYTLPQHTQYNDDSVEFYNGIVRVHTYSAPIGTRKVLNVLRTQNIGVVGAPLILYASDGAFPQEQVDLATYDGKLMADNVTTANQTVNYYPGYKVYLYADASHGLTEDYILPGPDEDMHYSIFGLRSYDNLYQYYSRISVPALMFARKIVEPKKPKQPLGGLYATRPDFFDKATYTFTTEFEHIPYSIQFGRASDIQILSSIYNGNVTAGHSISTLEDVTKNIFRNGDELFYMSRWSNLLSFNYAGGQFEVLPENTGVALPLPDSPDFIKAIKDFIVNHNQYYTNEPDVNSNITITSLNQQIIPATPLHGALYLYDFLQEIIYNCFVPLTEIPVLYQYIKGPGHTPLPKKQNIRDKNGNLLKPSDNGFDMAPMMKITTTTPKPKVQFTDFGIDGASKARYLYVAKEMNLQMKTGPYSDILGPISLVNTNPPPAPEIVRVLSVLENPSLGISPAVQFEINSYPAAQGITRINVHRTNSKADALSVRTMDIVKVIDIAEQGMVPGGIWTFKDDFSDLDFVPYGDLLYYRITVAREIKYNDSAGTPVIDTAPSETSEVLMTNVVNNVLPESPTVIYYSEPISQGVLHSVILAWEQTVYNGKYHIYKMNSQGNWVKIQEVVSNLPMLYLPVGDLNVADSDGNPIYHHYKVLAENFSGMGSNRENILTIYKESSWLDIGGIGAMFVDGTFIVR